MTEYQHRCADGSALIAQINVLNQTLQLDFLGFDASGKPLPDRKRWNPAMRSLAAMAQSSFERDFENARVTPSPVGHGLQYRVTWESPQTPEAMEKAAQAKLVSKSLGFTPASARRA